MNTVPSKLRSSSISFFSSFLFFFFFFYLSVFYETIELSRGMPHEELKSIGGKGKGVGVGVLLRMAEARRPWELNWFIAPKRS